LSALIMLSDPFPDRSIV